MAKTLQLRRGTTAELDAITGAEGELFVDLDTDTVRVHDGVTQGGIPLVNQAALDTKVNSTGGGYANNAITRYDGTTGTVIQNSLVTIADTGAITAPNNTGSMIPFYYPTLASFPAAANSHGAVAHAHNTGKMYYAHAGAWIELANMTDVSSGGSSYDQDLNTTDSVTFDSLTVTSNAVIPTAEGIPSGPSAWTSGGNLTTGRNNHAGAGTQTAALAFGGHDGSVIIASTEEYDGTSWSSGSDLGTSRFEHAGAGTQTAALAFGGRNDSFSTISSTEEYDGTSWTAGGNLTTGRNNHAGAGTQTAALAFGGNISFSAISSTEEYDGTSWTAGGNLITARDNHAGAGTQTAALAFGGDDGQLSSTEEYDGTSWSSGGNLSTARSSHAGAGTQTAALAFAGTDASFNFISSTEEYDGASWSSGGNLGTPRFGHAGAGTQTAALAFGGRDTGAASSAITSTEEYSQPVQPPTSTGTTGEIRYNEVTGVFEGYGVSQWDSFNSAPVSLFSLPDTDITSPANGQSLVYNSSTEKWENSNYTQVPAVDEVVGDGAWSSGGNLITGRTDHAGAGTQTAALAFGGSGPLASTEEYDGTSWTAGGNLGTARYNHSGAGTQTAALAFGGQTNDGISASTEEYDGTTWTAGGNLITARYIHAGAGTQTAALAFGGDTEFGALNTTEEYDGMFWSSGGNLSTGRFGHAGAGTQTAALAFGGLNQAYTLISSTEEYDGTSWTAGGNLSTGRFGHAGAGTQTAALAFGGQDSSFSTISSTEEYDGTSWTAGDNLGTARAGHAGAGTQTAALAFGGNGPLSSTEEYDATIQPPSSTGTVGEIRYNEVTGVFEGYTGTQWVALSTAV